MEECLGEPAAKRHDIQMIMLVRILRKIRTSIVNKSSATRQGDGDTIFELFLLILILLNSSLPRWAQIFGRSVEWEDFPRPLWARIFVDAR